MLLWDFLSALLVGLLFTAIFIVGYGRERGWGSICAALFLIFLTVWAGGKWSSQFYLLTQGAFWLPALIVGMLLILVLTAIIPGPERSARGTAGARRRSFATVRYWVIAIFLATSLIAWYVAFSQPGAAKFYNGPATLKNWGNPGSRNLSPPEPGSQRGENDTPPP